MSAFADTSFLFAFYFPRAASEQAMAKMESLQDAPLISSLVRYEFQQAVWFKVWLHAQGQPLGLSEPGAQSARSRRLNWMSSRECGPSLRRSGKASSPARRSWRLTTLRDMERGQWIFCTSPSRFNSARASC